MMRVTKTGVGAALPINLDELRDHLHIEAATEDHYLASLLNVSVEYCEGETRRAITRQEYQINADRFPVDYWPLPLGYIESVDQIQYIDVDGNTQTWDPTRYEIDNGSQFQTRLRPIRNESWPSTGDYFSAAQLTVTAGYTSSTLPYTLRQAILLMASAYYEGRAPGDPETANIEAAAKHLLSGWALPFIGL